jgi:predicted transposase YbfD/YdcC
METIIATFRHLDPRDQNARHDFCELLFIALAAALCGAKNCSDFARFAQEREEMLRTILTLRHGLASHDTFSALFRMVNSVEFAKAFATFAAKMAAAVGPNKHIAIDGKAMRGAFERGRQYAPRMMVSAWGCEVRMTLAALPAVGGNETKAAIELLQLLDLKGAVVTADALHCTPPMAKEITERGGDYVLALKANQPGLHAAAKQLAATTRSPKRTIAQTTEHSHGRDETRVGRVIAAPGLAKRFRFAKLVAIGEVERTRIIKGKVQHERWLYALSRHLSGAELLSTVRGHWDIENGLHWGLDVVYGEDACRTRKDHGSENLSLLRRLCVNTFRSDSKTDTMRGKMMRAGWNDSYLFKLMTHMR